MWAIGLFLFLLGIILVIVAPIGKKKNSRCSSADPAGLSVDACRCHVMLSFYQ